MSDVISDVEFDRDGNSLCLFTFSIESIEWQEKVCQEIRRKPVRLSIQHWGSRVGEGEEKQVQVKTLNGHQQKENLKPPESYHEIPPIDQIDHLWLHSTHTILVLQQNPSGFLNALSVDMKVQKIMFMRGKLTYAWREH